MIKSDQTIKVILAAGDIPDGATVTKVTGEQQFTLKRNLKIYGEHGVEITNTSDKVLFMVSSGGVINTIDKDKMLCWLTTPKWLFEVAREEEMEDK
jgi:phage-related protein